MEWENKLKLLGINDLSDNSLLSLADKFNLICANCNTALKDNGNTIIIKKITQDLTISKNRFKVQVCNSCYHNQY